MRFRELTIEGFGFFRARRFEFADGVNVFVGNNEAGKSTLVCALAAALFGLDRRRAPDKDLHALYRPRDEHAPFATSVVVEDEATQARYRIERDFSLGTCSMVRLEPDGRGAPVPGSPADRIARLMGLSSLGLFKSTVFITHADMANVHEGKPAKAISERATGGDAEASAAEAAERLRRRLADLTRKGQSPDRYGELQRAEEAVREAEEALQRIDRNMAEHEQLKAALERHEQARAEAAKVIEQCGPVVDRWQRYVKARERFETVKRQHEAAVKRLESIHREEAELRRLLAAIQPFEPVREALSDDAAAALANAERALAAAQSALAQCEQARAETESRLGDLGLRRSRAEERLTELQRNAVTPEVLARLAVVRKTIDERKAEAEALRERGARLEGLVAQARVRRSGATAGLVLFAVGLVLLFLTRGGTGRPLGLVAAAGAALVGLATFAVEMVRWQRLERRAGEMEEVRRSLEKVRADIDSLERERDFVEMGRCYDDLVAASAEIGASRREVESLKGMEQALVGQLERNVAAAAEHAQRVAEARGQLDELLARAACATPADYADKRSIFVELVRQARVAEAKLGMLLDRREVADWEADLGELTAERLAREREIEEARAALGGPGLDPDPAAYDDYRSRLEAAKQQEEAARLEIAAAGSRLEAHRVHAMGGDRHEAAANLLAARRLLDRRLLERDALQKALDALTKAYDTVDRALAPLMQRRALEIFSTITGGRYSQVEVRVAADELKLQVTDPVFGRAVDPAGLSTGTREQLYLAMRVALAEYLTGGRSFPILMDDPLVGFDRERLDRTLDVLVNLAQSHQLILVTIHEHLGAELARRTGGRARVVSLGEQGKPTGATSECAGATSGPEV